MAHPLASQDFFFTNGFGVPVYLNGGYAGINDYSQLSMQLQKGGGPISIPGFNHVAAYDSRVSKLHGGIGLVWSSEYMKHLWNRSLFKGVYALHLSGDGGVAFHPFISLAIGINHLSGDNIDFGSTLQGPLNKTYFSSGAGFLFKYKNLSAGFAAEHFNRPDIGWENLETRLEPKYNAHLRWKKQMEEDIYLLPGLIGHWQGQWAVVIPSVEIYYNGFIAGINLFQTHWGDLGNQTGVGGMIGIDFSSIRLVYSYNGKISGIQTLDIPSHEFALNYRFNHQ